MAAIISITTLIPLKRDKNHYLTDVFFCCGGVSLSTLTFGNINLFNINLIVPWKFNKKRLHKSQFAP